MNDSDSTSESKAISSSKRGFLGRLVDRVPGLDGTLGRHSLRHDRDHFAPSIL